ncbi:CARDB domain-containing protein [Owenweeksia hongkongensis]|uniref:CARDB domain-containing protein n=1 Tax=Owenweeksia hongkongensis TaxID=253245 RepID=UPI003A91F221
MHQDYYHQQPTGLFARFCVFIKFSNHLTMSYKYPNLGKAMLVFLALIPTLIFGQTVQIGSGTSLTGTSSPSPVNNRHRSQHLQMVYSKGELNAVGITAGNIEKLGFYIASSTSQAMPDYKISLGHTTARDAWPYLNDPLQQVYYNASYAPAAGGFDMLRLDTAWYWNGVDNIIVDVCFDYGFYPNISTGTVRTYIDSNYRISYDRSSVIDLCGATNPSSTVDKPQIQFEFTAPMADDAAVVDITPNAQVCGGSQAVSATIINHGTNALTSATVNWSVNGVVQAPANFAGSLSAQGGSANVSLGNYSFVQGMNYTILAWTTLPNGNTDSNSDNDSLGVALTGGLSGTYTIGGGGADYVSFTNAVNDLETYGVCGDVTFNVTSGGYFEQLEINEIPGVNANATITFQSASGDSSTVVLSHGANSAANYTLYINGGSWVTFKNLTIESTDNYYDRVVLIGDESNHLSFENNIIRNVAPLTPYNYRNIEIPTNANSDWLNFSNNRIYQGHRGIYNASQYSDHYTITDNVFLNQKYGGVEMYYADFVTIDGNEVITDITNTSGIQGILVYDADSSVSIQRNTVRGGTSGYGISLQYNNPVGGGQFLIANNFVSIGRNTGTTRGIYLLGCRYTDVVFNTVNVTVPSTNHYGIQVSSYNDNRLYNNNAQAEGGYALYVNSSNDVVDSDHNNWYTGGSVLAYWQGTTVSDLVGLQSASGLDSNSFSEPPYFQNDSSYQVSQVSLNNNAMPYTGLTTDIEGEARNGTNPDIGCDEFTPSDDDAGMLSVIPPATPFAPGNLPVYAVLKNFGNNTLTSATIDWEVNGVVQSSVNFAGAIASGDTTTVLLGNVNFVSGTIYTVDAYSSLPNGNADGNIINDSAAVGPLTPGLGGIFTIGGTSPDFADLTTAVEILNLGGTYDSTIFNVRSGTYTERIVISGYPKLNPTDHVTFRSEAQDSSAVVITEGYLNSSTNFVVALHGAIGVSFEKLTIQNTSTNSYGTAVQIDFGSSYISLNECAIIGGTTNSAASAAIYARKSAGAYPPQHHIYVTNCSLSGTYYGAYFYGVSNRDNNIIIENCHISDFYGTGVYVYLGDSVWVMNNTIIPRSSVTTNSYGAYLYDLHEGEFSGNQILGHGLRYGAEFGFLDGVISNPFIVANNFITSGGNVSSGRAVYTYACTYTKFVHNSLWCSNSQNNAVAFQDHNNSATIDVLNNICLNTGGGYAYDKNSASAQQTIDYNNLYTTGTFLARYGIIDISDFATWQNTSGHDSNSVSIDPQFVAMNDLHTNASALNATGTPLSYVTTDIDGDGRDPVTPDIGADEFVLAGSDAALLGFDAPQLPFAAGLQNVYVSLLNNGGDTLTSVNIHWSVNGVAQATFPWTGSLKSSEIEDSINIGSLNFVEDTAYSLRAWVSLPNGNADILATNDTIEEINLLAALIGTYTVGGVTPDFPDFTTAANALKKRGVAGNVIFNVRDGVYNEEIVIHRIHGVSSMDSVIFQSENADSAAVVLRTGNSGVPTLQIRGASWLTLKDMTIEHTYYWVGPDVIRLDSGVSNINIIGCIIKDSLHQSSISVGDYLIRSYGVYPHSNINILNCTFKNGRYGFYLPAVSNANRDSDLRVRNCVFDDQYYQAINVRYQDNLMMTGNSIINRRGYTAYDGITIDQIGGLVEVSQNQMRHITRYGLALYNISVPQGTPAIVANNYIHMEGSSSSAVGIYLYISSYVNLVYNSVSSFTTSASSRALYGYVNNNTNVLNNIFQQHNNGMATEWLSNSTSNTVYDYNNLYTAGANLGEYQNSAYTDLASWVAGSGQDSNSVSIDAQFSDTTDYHVESGALDGTGIPLTYVSTDLDGELRDAATPDIGADEISINTNDASLTAYLRPSKVFAPGNQIIYVDLLNNGSDSLTSVQINWTVNGVVQTAFNWAGALATGQGEDSVAVGIYNFTPLTSHDVVVYTSMPNGQSDDLPVNDTVKKLSLYPGLAGIYTIGGVSPDFADFTTAIQAMNDGGIVTGVTFNVRDGVYNEQLTLDPVMGATSFDSIVFQSENVDSSLVIIEFNANSSARHTILINDADHVHFRNMTLSGLNTNYAYIAHLVGNTDGLSFENCRFSLPVSNAGIYGVYATGGSSRNDLKIANCLFVNGSYGINVNGNNSSGLVVQGNHLLNQRSYGAYMYHWLAPQVIDNRFETNNSNTGYRSLYCGEFHNDFEISGNRAHVPIGSYGFYFDYLDGGVSARGLIANNFVTVGDSSASNSNFVGMRYFGGSYTDIFYNSFNHASNVGEAVQLFSSSTIDVKNNIMAATNGGYALESNMSPAAFDAMDHNDFYSSGANLFNYTFSNIGTIATLASWQGQTGLDANSIVADPLFVSSVDLHVNQSALDSAAIPVAQITVDIDGQLRDPVNPDIGADEISFLSGDIAVTAIGGISSGCGLSDSVQVTITIANNGTDPQTGFDVTLVVDGDTTTETFGASIASGANANYSFTPYYDLSSIGTYSITAWSSLTGDVNSANDTNSTSIDHFAPPVISITSDTTICGGTPVQLTASGGVNFFWSTGLTGPSITVAPNDTTVYTVTVTDVNGCQALDSVTVFVSNSIDSVFISGFTCDSTMADTMMNVYVNQGGCDSVVYTVLTYTPSYITNLPDTTICQGDTIDVFGMSVSMAGTYYDSLSTVGGCDSIFTKTVIVNPSDTLILPIKTICQGDSTQIFGTYRSVGGTYVRNLTNQYGCDSVEVCELIVNPVFNVSINASICEGQSIFVGGAAQTMAGTYYDTLQTSLGCDSVLATIVSITPVDSTQSTTNLITGDSLLVGGAYQTTSGTYYDTFTGTNGCDSVHSIVLNFLSPARSLTYSGNSGFINSIISPTQGDAYSQFNFEVEFTDTNGILPPFGFPRVILDFEGNGIFNNTNDRTIIMTEVDANDTDPSDGKIYSASISGLPIGVNWETRVVVVEGGNTTVLGPQVSAPQVLALPDVEIFANDISFSDPNPAVSSPLTVSATVHNASDYDAQNFVVHLVNQFDTTIAYPDITISNLPARSSTTVSWNITTPAVDAWCPMQVWVDYTNVISETNELDNTALRPFTNGNFNIPGAINVIANTSPSVLCSNPGSSVTISGFAYYTGTAVPLTDSSVAGAQVDFTVGGATYTAVTNSLGNFSKSVPAPIAIGGYSVLGTVTDFTLTGNLSTSFQVKNCGCSLPDLRTTVSTSAHTIIAGQSVTGSFTVSNIGTALAPASVLTLNQTGGAPALINQPVPALAPSASSIYNFPAITFNVPGTYSICATADGTFSIAECTENNTACATIRVLPNLPDIIPVSGPGNSSYLCNAVSPAFTVRNAGGVATGQFVCKVDVSRNGLPEGTFYHTITNIPAQQNVGFSIPYNYPSVGSYSFVISCDTNVATGGIVAEVSELNNTGTYGKQINACMPDLAVVGCRPIRVSPIDPQFPGSVDYEIHIRNGGNATATGPIPIRFTVTPGNVFNTTFPGNLAPGQSATVTVNTASVAPATATLTATIDPLNAIAEFSESNNSASDDLCWEFQPVPKCYGNFWDKSYLINQTAFLSVGVQVEHLYEASSVDVQFEVSGPGIVGTQNLGNATINNVHKTCVCPLAATLPSNFVFNQVGTYTFTMTVDPNNVYTECNEGNNVLVKTVTVGSAPDMRILSQFINPSMLNPDVNDTVGIIVTYENIGHQNINDQMELKLLVNNVPIDSIKPVSGLVTGDNASFNFPMVWGTNIPGAHIIRAIIDSDNEVLETDELNNEATRAIVVGDAANLYFQSLIASNAAPALLDTIILTAEIGNAGDVDAVADVAFSYINDIGDTIYIGAVPISVVKHDSATVQLRWWVQDVNTTIVAEIINTNTLEFLYTDNMATTPIGGFAINISATDACYANANGTLTAAASGGVAPYSYTWSTGQPGAVLTDGPGTYSVTVQDVNGTLAQTMGTIGVAPGTLMQLPSVVVCQGDSVLIFGKYRHVAATYRDTIPGVGGCDTVQVVTLRYKPTHNITLPTLAICEGDSAMILGAYRSVGGLYIDSLTNVGGCDSIRSQALIVNPVDTTHLTATTNDPAQAGTFIAQLTAMSGCDSTVITVVTYVPGNCPSIDSITISAVTCDSTMTGINSQTFVGSDGCDSIVTTITTYDSGSMMALPAKMICQGDSIMIFGNYEKIAAVYYDSLANQNGCDSLISCELILLRSDTVYQSSTTTDSTMAGVLDTLYTNVEGCDSLVITTIIYSPLPCTNDSLTVNAVTCDSTMAGTVITTYPKQGGCDSVVTTITTYDPGSMMALPAKAICDGDSIMVFGNYRNMAGVYYDSLQNQNGCDSILSCELILKPNVTISLMDSICPGSGLFVGGAFRTTAGVYYDTLMTSNGCDSILITTLTIRTDPGCGVQPTLGDSLVIVTDIGWMKSTVTNTAEAGGYPWMGVSSLPATTTYVLPAEIGQPNPWHSIDSVEGAHVFKSGNGVTFFRTTFALTVNTGVMAQIRSYMDDGMEIYINGQMLAREDDREVSNSSGAQHHLMLMADGNQSNGHNGDQMFDVVNNYRMDSLVNIGQNELVIALRNAPQSTDKGGFSFRMDLKTGVSLPKQLSQYIVSDAEWMKSTVTTPGGSSWNWPGVASLPAANTFTEEVELGQPYSWYSTQEVEGSFAIKATENVTYYKRRFNITDSANISARLRSTFDENLMVFINDSLIAGHYQHGLQNRAMPAHDVDYPSGGAPVNGNAGGDMFMQVENVDWNQILRKGDNYITVVLQNRANEPGGFSLRLDLNQSGAPVIRKVDETNEGVKGANREALTFNLYPNPTTGMVYVKLVKSPSDDNQVLVFDLNGKLLYQRTLINPETGLMDIDLKDYADGMYIIRIRSGGEMHLGKRVMKF